MKPPTCRKALYESFYLIFQGLSAILPFPSCSAGCWSHVTSLRHIWVQVRCCSTHVWAVSDSQSITFCIGSPTVPDIIYKIQKIMGLLLTLWQRLARVGPSLLAMITASCRKGICSLRNNSKARSGLTQCR